MVLGCEWGCELWCRLFGMGVFKVWCRLVGMGVFRGCRVSSCDGCGTLCRGTRSRRLRARGGHARVRRGAGIGGGGAREFRERGVGWVGWIVGCVDVVALCVILYLLGNGGREMGRVRW